MKIKLNTNKMQELGMEIIDLIRVSELTKLECMLVLQGLHESFKEEYERHEDENN